MTLGDFTPFRLGAQESKFCGPYLRNGHVCYIHIYKQVPEGWRLSVSTRDKRMMETDARFPSEAEARDHFLRLVELVGIEPIAAGQADLAAASARIRQGAG